jgi:DNA-directed RNA polymerase
MLQIRSLFNCRLLAQANLLRPGTLRSIRLELNSLRSAKQQTVCKPFVTETPEVHSLSTDSNANQSDPIDQTIVKVEEDAVPLQFEQFSDNKIPSFPSEVIQIAEQIAEQSQKQIALPVFRKRNIDRMYISMQFKQTIVPYLHACVNSSMTDRAFTTVNWYNFKNKMFDNCDAQMIRDICNVLLKGYAIQNRLKGSHEVFKLMRHFEVQPDLKSYAWYLYVLSKNDRTKQAVNVLNDMKQKGLLIQDLFCESNLNQDQQFVIRQFVKKFNPTLEFTEPKENFELGCDITETLRDMPRAEYLPYDQFDVNTFRKEMHVQMELEKQGRSTIKSVYKAKPTTRTQFCREQLNKLEQEWKTVLLNSLNFNLEVIKNKYTDMNGMNVYPYLCSLDLKALVDMMVDEAIMLGRTNGTYSPPSYLNYLNLGRRIQNHYLTQILLKNFPEVIDLYDSFLNYYTDPKLMAASNPREHWQRLARDRKLYLNPDVNEMVWPYSVTHSIGKMMYEIMMKELKIDANMFKETHKKRIVPAFLTIYTRDKVKLQEELRCNMIYSKLFQEAQGNELHFDPSMLPMLVPPAPWINPKRGGYLFTNVEIIRENLNEVSMCRDRLSNRNLNTIYDALNVVSMCAWKVNQPVSLKFDQFLFWICL